MVGRKASKIALENKPTGTGSRSRTSAALEKPHGICSSVLEMRSVMKIRRMLQSSVLALVGICLCFLTASAAHAQWSPMNPVEKVQQEPDGVLFSMATGALKVQICSDSVIHILYSPTATFPKRADLVVVKESWPSSAWTMQSTDDAVTLTTSLLKITVTRTDGAIAYTDGEWGCPVPGSVPSHDSSKSKWGRHVSRGILHQHLRLS